MGDKSNLISDIERQLECTIESSKTVGGGCISKAYQIKSDDGRCWFLKCGANANEIYEKEARGLEELRKSACIVIPKVALCENDYLLLEWIEPGARSKHFFEKFGESLSLMHRFVHTSFGFKEDNYLGNAVQPNQPTLGEERDWKQFYWNKRLLYQLKWAEKQGCASKELIHLFVLLEERYYKIMQNSENIPVLLHGDLWSGNYLVGKQGEPVLIDPAVYYGNREAELAMTKLFGGFDQSFYEAYEASYPLPDGYEERENLYKLYHVLNHLNLFGSSYLREAESLVRSYL